MFSEFYFPPSLTMFQPLGSEFTLNELLDAEKQPFLLGPPHSPHSHTLKKPHPEEASPCTHARKHTMDSNSLRIPMKFTGSETWETLETEALLPEACVQFCPEEIER